MKCNKTLSKWCKNKHVASKIIDTFETYQEVLGVADVEVLGVVDRDAAAGCGRSSAMLPIARLLKRCMEAAIRPPVEAH
jgi:hypothetical protein